MLFIFMYVVPSIFFAYNQFNSKLFSHSSESRQILLSFCTFLFSASFLVFLPSTFFFLQIYLHLFNIMYSSKLHSWYDNSSLKTHITLQDAHSWMITNFILFEEENLIDLLEIMFLSN